MVGDVEKGYLDFAGVCVIERLEFVVQRDPRTGKTFPNLATDLVVLKLDDNDEVDWRWIDDRRDSALTAHESHLLAPASLAHLDAKGSRRPPEHPAKSDQQPGEVESRSTPPSRFSRKRDPPGGLSILRWQKARF